MMLVEHDLDAFILCDQPLVDIAVVERGAPLRIVKAVGQRHADGLVLLRRRQIRIGILAEVPGFHDAAPDLRAAWRSSRKCAIAAAVRSRCSTCGKCPAPAIVSMRACGKSAA